METKPTLDTCFFKKTRPDAVIPFKAHPSDVGYDLTLVGIAKRMGMVTLYTTGIIAMPPVGYSIDIVPRSGISKTGHLLANSIGIIDPHYRGELLIALWKYDPQALDLVLPTRFCQIVFRQNAPDFKLEEVENLDLNTDRGSTGFGSSGS